jgi:hypothetical protein
MRLNKSNSKHPSHSKRSLSRTLQNAPRSFPFQLHDVLAPGPMRLRGVATKQSFAIKRRVAARQLPFPWNTHTRSGSQTFARGSTCLKTYSPKRLLILIGVVLRKCQRRRCDMREGAGQRCDMREGAGQRCDMREGAGQRAAIREKRRSNAK